MARLGGARRAPGQIALAQLAQEDVDDERVAGQRQLRVVARALVSHERVGAVELVPGEIHPRLVETPLEQAPTLGWDVRILTAPDHEQLALDVAGAREAVVAPCTEAALMNVRGVEAGRGQYLGVHRGAE